MRGVVKAIARGCIRGCGSLRPMRVSRRKTSGTEAGGGFIESTRLCENAKGDWKNRQYAKNGISNYPFMQFVNVTAATSRMLAMSNFSQFGCHMRQGIKMKLRRGVYKLLKSTALRCAFGYLCTAWLSEKLKDFRVVVLQVARNYRKLREGWQRCGEGCAEQ